MKIRLFYIMIFLMTFLSPSLAQNSFIEYVFSDGTKENEPIGLERIRFNWSHCRESLYRIKNIIIENVFDKKANVLGPKGMSVTPELIIYFEAGEPIGGGGPYPYGFIDPPAPNIYEILEKKENNNGTVTIQIKGSYSGLAYYKGKRMSSLSGRITYPKFRNISSKILSEELTENLKPFYLDSLYSSGDACVRLISPSYDETAKKANLTDLSIERVTVVNNLKRLGYSLVSQKGEFPLTYRKEGEPDVRMYETYIEICF